MEEKYLPIGSVVLLKGGVKTIMITGYLPMPSGLADPTNVYDYSACMFPEGLLSSDQNAVFNHDQIDKILYKGFVNEESIPFLNEVKIIANLQKTEQLGISQNITTQAPVVETLTPEPVQQVQPVSTPQVQSNPFADPMFNSNQAANPPVGFANNNMFY